MRRIDQSQSVGGGATKFAGGADVRILEIRVPIGLIKNIHVQHPSTSLAASAIWHEMFLLSTYNGLRGRLGSSSKSKSHRFVNIKAVWEKDDPEVQEAMKAAEPKLRSVKEGR